MRRVSLFVVAALVAFPLTTAGARPVAQRRVPALAPVGSDALAGAFKSGELSGAEYALARAQSVFQLRKVRNRFGAVSRPDARAATLLLRDLAVRVPALEGEDLALARAILARPTGGPNPLGNGYTVAEATPKCTTNVCVHFVTSTTDVATTSWVDEVSSTFESVWAKEIGQMGWRAPKSDTGSTYGGPDGKLDVYVQDVAADGAYGYCTSDDPHLSSSSTYQFLDMSSYCVVDNDFSKTQFPNGAFGVEALEVTAAHEFNHAVHFAYDFFEDHWLLEATATWMEDEVYDAINDNVQYLPASPIADPHLPLDTFFPFDSTDPNATFQYGTWVFFRYMSERYADPDVVREVWQKADGGPAGPSQIDGISLNAINSALAARGDSFAELFADFGATNVDPAGFYEEGTSYPTPPRATTHLLSATTTSGAGTLTQDHLTNQYVSFKPSGLAATDNLTIALDLPASAASPRAKVVAIPASGTPVVTPVALDAAGVAEAHVPGFGGMTEVVLVLTNASTRFDRSSCGLGLTMFSCAGASFTDENLKFNYSGAVGDIAVPPGGSGPPGGDTTAPRITGVSDGPDPFTPNNDKRKDKVRIKWTVDELSITSVTIFKNNGTTRVKRLAVAETAPGQWFIAWNGKGANGRVVSGGSYVYKIVSVDLAGNTARARGRVTVRR